MFIREPEATHILNKAIRRKNNLLKNNGGKLHNIYYNNFVSKRKAASRERGQERGPLGPQQRLVCSLTRVHNFIERGPLGPQHRVLRLLYSVNSLSLSILDFTFDVRIVNETWNQSRRKFCYLNLCCERNIFVC